MVKAIGSRRASPKTYQPLEVENRGAGCDTLNTPTTVKILK